MKELVKLFIAGAVLVAFAFVVWKLKWVLLGGCLAFVLLHTAVHTLFGKDLFGFKAHVDKHRTK